MCNNISETLTNITSLVLNFNTQSVVSAIACGCSVEPTEPCETTNMTSENQANTNVDNYCVFDSTVQEEIYVINNAILSDYGRGHIWREKCEFSDTNSKQCLITSNVTLTDDGLNSVRELMYFFQQSSGYGSRQYFTGSIDITGKYIRAYNNVRIYMYFCF